MTGAVGLIGEALRPLLGAGYAVAGVLVIVWFFAIGVQLAVLARRSGVRRTGGHGPGRRSESRRVERS